jgi:hypothetical protein
MRDGKFVSVARKTPLARGLRQKPSPSPTQSATDADISSGSDMEYTVVTSKRGPGSSSSGDERTKPTVKRAAKLAIVPTTTANRFAPLTTTDTSKPQDPKMDTSVPPAAPAKKHKVPPVCVKNFHTHKALMIYVSQTTKRFTITPRRDFSRVQLESIEDYRALTSALENDKAEYYTFSESRPKTQRFVIRGLPSNAEPGEIAEELEWLGIATRSVTQLHRHTEERRDATGKRLPGDKLPLFSVALTARAPGTQPVDLTSLTRLQNCVVSLEAPRDTVSQAPMCFRCQHIGHVSEHCRRQARCVSCGQDHASNTCTVPKTVKAKCTNCGGDHPANYRGCEYLRQAQARRQAQQQQQRGERRATEPERPASRIVVAGVSYARVATPPVPVLEQPPVHSAPPTTDAEHAAAPTPPPSQPEAAKDIFASLLSGLDWKSLVLMLAKMIAEANINPTVTALALLVPNLLMTLTAQNA